MSRFSCRRSRESLTAACLRCGSVLSTGQLSGALCPDRALPRPHSDPSPPTLGPDQLAFLGLPAPLPAGPAFGPADYLWIRADNTDHCFTLHCRLVSCTQAHNGCLSPFLNLISSFLSKCSIKQQIWHLKCKWPLSFWNVWLITPDSMSIVSCRH